MNYFDQVADRQLTNPQKAKERVKKKWEEKREAKARGPTPLQLKQMDDAVLLKMYRDWRREIKQKIVETHTTNFAALMRLLRNLDWNRAEDVVEYVRDAAWLLRSDEGTRLATLSYIDGSLIRSRIRHGIAPIDDGFLDEPPDVFIRVRRIMVGY